MSESLKFLLFATFESNAYTIVYSVYSNEQLIYQFQYLGLVSNIN